MYIITKQMQDAHVLLLQGEEVWEFTNEDDAQIIADTLSQNSTHGYVYTVRKVG